MNIFNNLFLFNKEQKKIIKQINKSWWFKLLILLIMILLLIHIFRKQKIKENFTGKKKYILKEGNEVYDDFYADLYDEFLHDKVKNSFEVKKLINTLPFSEESKLLDIGSGTGQMVHLFNKNNIEAEGLDISPSMIRISKENFPDYQFSEGNALDNMLYPSKNFSHISCFYFTIYYIEDKDKFFENTYNWLEKDGYLIIHLVNRKLFDPILDKANPITAVSVQKYAKKRITTSTIKFGDFLYKAKFKLNEDYDEAIFTETMKHDTSESIRKNVHHLYMEKKSKIVKIAKNNGFELIEKISLVHIGYEYQYLYIFQKTD